MVFSLISSCPLRRWAHVCLAVTKFCGIYSSIERNPPSGSEPLDWLCQAKILFHNQTKKEFAFESAWTKLQDAPKWKIALNKSAGPVILGSETPSTPTPTPAPQPTPNTDSAATPTPEADPGTPSNNGRRPIGVKGEKQALTQAELMEKKL
jgi:hypothetical protein